MGFCNARYVPIANKAVAHLGLSEASTWPLLAVSRYGDGHRQMVIANILGIKAPSLTRPLDHLEREGLIERRDDPIDGRAKTLHLTAKGRTLAVQIEATLKALRSRGIRVAVDDFGTGYSSLGHLHRFPVDTLKIDKSFVHEIGKTGERARVAGAVIALARSLNMRVVAEGVETFEERDFLRENLCDDAQGYYFGHPVSPDEFGELLKTGRQMVVMI